MADVERAKRIQHAHESNALSYGHFGTATYDDQLHSWTFLRQTQIQSELPLEDGNGTGPESIHDPTVEPAHSNLYSGSAFSLIQERLWAGEPGRSKGPEDELRVSDAIEDHAAGIGGKIISPRKPSHAGKNTFLKQIPDAALAVFHLPTTDPPYAALSVNNGNILAFGNARLASEHGARNSPLRSIVAFAAGPGGAILRLLGLDASDVPVRDSSGLEQVYSVPAIGHQAQGYWANSAEPVLHVSSSAHQHRAQFLVVKSSGTSILRPLMVDNVRSDTSTSDNSRNGSHSAGSLLQPTPVVTVPTSRTGGNPHAHAALNPQDQNSLAVVDTHGLWSIWKLKGTRARSARVLFRVQLACSNDLANSTGMSPSTNGRLHYDGWHRICWLKGEQGYIDRILVCNRRSAAVFERTGALVGSVDMRLGPSSEGNEILDVQNSDRQTGHVLVLTTSRLLIFTSSEASWKDQSGTEPLALVCSWNHFRARDDSSLRMSLCEFPRTTCVLVYSRASYLTVVYQFGPDRSNRNTVSLRDPSIFEIPRQLQARMKDVNEIVLCPVKPVAAGYAPTQTDDGFLKLAACLTDGTIIEAVYKHRMGKQWETSEDGLKQTFSLSLPETTGNRVQSAKYVDEDELDELDDFVVHDEVREQRITQDGGALSQSDTDSPLDSRLRNWERLLEYETLSDRAHASYHLEDVLFEAAQRIHAMSLENKIDRMYLLSDILGAYQVADVEQDSELLKSWLDELRNSEGVSVESTTPHLGLLPGASQDNFLGLYDELIASYMESFLERVTDRNRVNRERLVRQAAADAHMSNVGLRIGKSEPAKPKATIAGEEVSSPPPESDQEGAWSSQVSGSQSPLVQEEPAVARLRRYAEFQEVVPSLQLSEDPNISSILAHLPDSIDEDPAEYSYRQVTQRWKLAQEEMATQSLDPRERRKAARHAARLQKKLDRTIKMSQNAFMQQTVLPSIATGSTSIGVTLPGREVQSSQMAAPESSQAASQTQGGIPGLSMTQPERGAFGRRPAKAKGKGKGKSQRTAGF
ncbi:hypothetical protein A1O3_09843 [Capronia epimyces CBS 606.96]|uniref:RNA polymerase I-specific transcription initiation factor RRN6-like protein n=1 Tax=Capronia epimyces CBS 606.96 TaxID=1182542 RepID=W9XJT8_9EURO|nr:uncharacterized protein A1O3_09843 [Capronia epimyces CBS 606.96]EXJ77615.1 hypothetical protein A1O3_09843 [Capronia epimyces CBS 606.96]